MTAERTALIVVHMQVGFARGDSAMLDLADRIAAWIREHRDRVDLLVAARFRNEPGSTYHRLVGDDMMRDEDVALLPVIEALDFDLECESPMYSAATSEILDALHEREIRTVLVVGVDTDQCVLATVFALFDADYEPVVLQDLCHATSGRTPHEAGLVALRRAVGEERVIASGQFIARPRA